MALAVELASPAFNRTPLIGCDRKSVGAWLELSRIDEHLGEAVSMDESDESVFAHRHDPWTPKRTL